MTGDVLLRFFQLVFIVEAIDFEKKEREKKKIMRFDRSSAFVLRCNVNAKYSV